MSDEPNSINSEPLQLSEVKPETKPDKPVSLAPAAIDSPPTDAVLPAEVKLHEISSDNKKPRSRKLLFVSLAAVFVAGLGVGVYVLTRSDTPVADDLKQTTRTRELGLAVTVADGQVEYNLGSGSDWQVLTAGSELEAGNSVRTGASSRAVLTFDDGSAVRLDENSSITIRSLAADDIQIEQLSGSIYNRVLESERKYRVEIEDVTYLAVGTAFTTIDTESVKGVQVIQSKVQVAGNEVPEGKQFYQTHPEAAISGKTSDINIEELKSSFMLWNLEQDEKDERYKSKLGLLAQLSEAPAEEMEVEEKPAPTSDELVRGNITLTHQNLGYNKYQLTWTAAGTAPYGYKVVLADHANATYPDDGYLYHGKNAYYTLKLDSKPAGTYYIRVCKYTDSTAAEKCVDYSNELKLVKS